MSPPDTANTAPSTGAPPAVLQDECRSSKGWNSCKKVNGDAADRRLALGQCAAASRPDRLFNHGPSVPAELQHPLPGMAHHL